MDKVEYLDAGDVVGVIRDANPPRVRSATGYGRKLPTELRLRMADNHIRRVYAICYSNAASHYVLVGGELRFIGPEVEGRIGELDRVNKYRAGAYTCPVPPVFCGNWTEGDWVKWIERHGKWHS